MASQSLGEQGSVVSEPVYFQWHWYYDVPTLPLWALIALLLVIPKQNRHLQAWLILIPLGLLLLVWRMPAMAFYMSDESTEYLGFLIVTGAIGWSIVWLIGPWIRHRHRATAFFMILAVMVAVGLLSYYLYHFEDSGDTLPLLIIYGLCVVILTMAMMITSYSYHIRYTPQEFYGWLLVWIFAMTIGLMSAYGILVMIFQPGLQVLGTFLIVLIPASVFLGVFLYLLNLPFLVLAFNSPFYRERFENIFHVGKKWDTEDRQYGYLYQESFSTEPTAKAVTPDDVVGRWQFYLDSASKTVVIDFKPDGTFAETILPNQGRIQECPGGTWKLEGPSVHLQGYVTVAGGAVESRTWWMIDLPSGLGLFGGDGAEAKSFFRMRRRQ